MILWITARMLSSHLSVATNIVANVACMSLYTELDQSTVLYMQWVLLYLYTDR